MISRDYYLLSTKYQCFTRGFGLSNESVSKVFYIYIYIFQKHKYKNLKSVMYKKKKLWLLISRPKKRTLQVVTT